MRDFGERYENCWLSRLSNESGHQGKNIVGDLFETVDVALSKSGKNLLDVGRGNCSLMDMVKDRVESIYGCDISKIASKVAKTKGMKSECSNLNKGYLPYHDEFFDIITCIEVAEHVIDPISLLKELYRVFCTKGYLVLTTPNIRYFRNLRTLLLNGTFPHTTTDSFVWGGGHLHYFTRKGLSSLLQSAGFIRIEFLINPNQFARSSKRLLFRKLIGEPNFGEWFCGGIMAKAVKNK
jgi:2-polyprenyl-3-methyl-5-hydroxy-6-metoxy-1,4-benzoquinol methylase